LLLNEVFISMTGRSTTSALNLHKPLSFISACGSVQSLAGMLSALWSL